MLTTAYHATVLCKTEWNSSTDKKKARSDTTLTYCIHHCSGGHESRCLRY